MTYFPLQTMHVLHQGRSRYCLIEPRPTSSKAWTPTVTYEVMGEDTSKGESRQLFVGGGVWKMSGIPDEDLAEPLNREKVGCLITEVVTPGFVWQDHEWMTMEDLKDLFKDAPDAEQQVAKFAQSIRPVDLS